MAATRIANYAVIDAGSSGNNSLVAAVSGKRIIVVGYLLMGGGTVTAYFRDGTGGSEITGPLPLVAQSVVQDTVPINPSTNQGLFQTGIGNALVLNLGGAVQVSGYVVYILDPL